MLPCLAFLSKEMTCQWLAEALSCARAELDYSLWAYVFMPEHVHLVVFPNTRTYDISRFLRCVKEPVARRAVEHLKRTAPQWLARIESRRGKKVEHHFWQPGRGYDRNIDSPRTLQQMIDYLHLNPVRRGLADCAQDWKWSSAGWFAGVPLNDLKPDSIPWEWLEDVRVD